MHHYKYQVKSQKTGTLPQISRLSLAIISTECVLRPTSKDLAYTGYAPSKDNNGDDLKTYVYRQTTTSPKVSKMKPKDKQNITPPKVLRTNAQLVY